MICDSNLISRSYRNVLMSAYCIVVALSLYTTLHWPKTLYGERVTEDAKSAAEEYLHNQLPVYLFRYLLQFGLAPGLAFAYSLIIKIPHGIRTRQQITCCIDDTILREYTWPSEAR